jgi:predicted ATPase
VLELGPLEEEDVTALLAARADSPLSAALTHTIVARSEGNPFYAEELLAASDRSGELPRRLRDLLLERVARLDERTRSLLHVASAVGRDVGYTLLCAVAGLPERDVRESLRQAVEHRVLVAEQRRTASVSDTRSSPRRSTRRSCPASARSCTRGSQRSSRAAQSRLPRS